MAIGDGEFPISPKILMKTTGKRNPNANVPGFLVWARKKYFIITKKALS